LNLLPQIPSRSEPALDFLAAVSLRFETPRAIGETPDGMRFGFMLAGTVEGPRLSGHFPRCVAYLLIDADGVGTIDVRAPLLLKDGAMAELEAKGRYDFGEAGYSRAVALDLPNSALGWCPRLVTGDARYSWLNRLVCVGVGELRPRETRVDYDLFAMTAPAPAAASPSHSGASPRPRGSLFQRVGGQPVIHAIMSGFVENLAKSPELARQNPYALARVQANPASLAQQMAEYVCALTGGPCVYTGRSLRASHEHLRLTYADWAIGEAAFTEALRAQNLGPAERDELLALIGPTKSQIAQRYVTGAR
jgi:truncated hemoglobin YjbI